MKNGIDFLLDRPVGIEPTADAERGNKHQYDRRRDSDLGATGLSRSIGRSDMRRRHCGCRLRLWSNGIGDSGSGRRRSRRAAIRAELYARFDLSSALGAKGHGLILRKHAYPLRFIRPCRVPRRAGTVAGSFSRQSALKANLPELPVPAPRRRPSQRNPTFHACTETSSRNRRASTWSS